MSFNTCLSPKLPLLEAMMDAINPTALLNLDNVAVIGVQHMLFTTASLIEILIKLGIQPKNMYFMGKNYSTCGEVVEHLCALGVQCQQPLPQENLGDFSNHFKFNVSRLWRQFTHDLAIRKFTALIILDDGATCLSTFPTEIIKFLPVIGIEQTTHGIKHPEVRTLPFPLIEVASSAVKQYLESPLIANTVIEKLTHFFPLFDNKLRCGVVGLGVIGVAITKKLLALGFSVSTYDKSHEKNLSIAHAARLTSVQALIQSTDYIFGCTGEDMTKDLDLEALSGKKYFISCSSKDVEFLTLLKHIAVSQNSQNKTKQNVLDDIEYQAGNMEIKIFKGGFPVNLDHSGESVPAHNIQLTRALLFGAVIQGIATLTDHQDDQGKNRHMLDPVVQKFIVANWLNHGDIQFYSKELLNKFYDSGWIQKNSGGFHHSCEFISKYFSKHEQFEKIQN